MNISGTVSRTITSRQIGDHCWILWNINRAFRRCAACDVWLLKPVLHPRCRISDRNSVGNSARNTARMVRRCRKSERLSAKYVSRCGNSVGNSMRDSVRNSVSYVPRCRNSDSIHRPTIPPTNRTDFLSETLCGMFHGAEFSPQKFCAEILSSIAG